MHTAAVTRLCCRLARSSTSILILALVAIVHPLIHGTPLDQGALDSVLDSLRAWATMSLPQQEAR